jgi:hypothetical protein
MVPQSNVLARETCLRGNTALRHATRDRKLFFGWSQAIRRTSAAPVAISVELAGQSPFFYSGAKWKLQNSFIDILKQGGCGKGVTEGETA